jgi:anti-sigma B factor antagonist
VVSLAEGTGQRPLSAARERLSVRTEPHPGGCVLVHVDGEIDQVTADLLREHVISAGLSACPPRLVLDLDRVTFCDSSGLGALVAIWKAVRAHHGDVVIARAPGICRRILQRTGLDQYLRTIPTLDHAIAHLTS